jgi:CheY-like chemotaxis protein
MLRVRVVEDEGLVAALIEDMLELLGHRAVAVASRVTQALAHVAENGFDVALLDVNLGGELVYPVAVALASQGVPFVFSTGYAADELQEPFRFAPRLQKPYDVGQLGRLLSSLALG